LLLRSVVLPRVAAFRPDFAAAETRLGRAAAGFFRPAAFAAAAAGFLAGALRAAFLRVAFFTGAASSARSMALATSDIGAMPLTDFNAPCQR
jgi:hypothetical protein